MPRKILLGSLVLGSTLPSWWAIESTCLRNRLDPVTPKATAGPQTGTLIVSFVETIKNQELTHFRLGSYELSEAENVQTGTKIVIHLKPTTKQEYTDPHLLESLIKKHNNFIAFPIYLNQKKINTIPPVWTMDKKDVTATMHTEFYRFIANAWDEPRYTFQWKAEVPVGVQAVLYVPGRHSEYMGMGRMEPGVGLYCRKILIQPKAKGLLPEYLRFVKGQSLFSIFIL